MIYNVFVIDLGIYFPDKPMPTFVHFCQNYMVNNIGFAKRRVPKDVFTCESPMFVDLPDDLGKTGEDSFRYKKNTVSDDASID